MEKGEAIPVGEGRYAIFERHDSTRLAYRLSSPGKPGSPRPGHKRAGPLAGC